MSGELDNFKFIANVNDKYATTIPLATLKGMNEKAAEVVALAQDILTDEYNSIRVEGRQLDRIHSILANASYIVGATNYYIGDKNKKEG